MRVKYKLLMMIPFGVMMMGGCAKYANTVQSIDYNEITLKDIKDNKIRTYVFPEYKMKKHSDKLDMVNNGDTVVIRTMARHWYKKHNVLYPQHTWLGAKFIYPDKVR